jgi:exodeoxyribonuclease V beta subunit
VGGAVTPQVFPDFDIVDPKVVNGTVIEASAGTGKTFSVAAFVARTIALNDDIRIGNILVTTFTRNAAAELRDRIRRRLVTLERQLRAGTADDGDGLAAALLGAGALNGADRLARALREFDTATISTIHSVCARILAMAGLPAVGEGDETDLDRIISEVVNDTVISEAMLGNVYNPARLRSVVEARLGSPLSVLSYAPYQKASGGRTVAELNAGLDHVIEVVESCVARIRSRTETEPTFDDLLRRAAELLSDSNQVALVAALRQRFRLAVIDEAQDTDKLQWSIFRHIFDPGSTTHTLVAVGDPKQAIYRFRGADIEAYLAVRSDDKRLTLRRNWRSDGDLLEALNHLFAGWTFGRGIDYVPVTARDGAPGSSIAGSKPLTIVDLGDVGSKNRVVNPTALRVREILEKMSITKDGRTEKVGPGDICVLVTSKSTGASVEAALRDLGVSAVSSGTESVMKGEMAAALTRLFRAMEEPHDTSRIRLVAATPFFGVELADAGALDEERIAGIQRTVGDWARVLRSGGVAAVAARLRGDEAVAARIVRGDAGERRETDFAHVVELLHRATNGAGCSPSDVLEAAATLAAREDQSETVSRRVESDRKAVQIMTVHASKGLEFPVVVVADLWKTKRNSNGADQFHRAKPGTAGENERVIDAGYVVHRAFNEAKAGRAAEEADEVTRLFYVALTRAKHHVSLVVAGQPEGSTHGGRRVTEGLNDPTRFAPVSHLVDVVPAAAIGRFPRYRPGTGTEEEPALAPFTGSTDRTYQRMSFSGITKKRQGRQADTFDPDDRSGAGHNDDDEQIISIRSGYCDQSVPAGVNEMPLARLVGGTYFGKIMHAVYERIDFTAADLEAEVARVVDSVVNGALLRAHRDELVRGVMLSIVTPMGGPFGDLRLSAIPLTDRLNELGFEMGLASAADGVKVSDIGRVLLDALDESGRSDDILAPYARELASGAFGIPLLGLMNGSIDTLLRVNLGEGQSLWVTDWKSNRLDEDGMDALTDGYARNRMCEEMEHHHYPLQALIYGVAVHRYVRARSTGADAPAVAGLAYFFIRGMTGQDTPVDAHGNRNGVFVWEAPAGLWDRLSDVMSGVRR